MRRCVAGGSKQHTTALPPAAGRELVTASPLQQRRKEGVLGRHRGMHLDALPNKRWE